MSSTPRPTDDVIRLRSEPDNATRIIFESLNASFESLNFLRPNSSGSITINAQDGNDKVWVEPLTGYLGSLTLTGGTGMDTVVGNANAAVSLSDTQLVLGTQTFALDIESILRPPSSTVARSTRRVSQVR